MLKLIAPAGKKPVTLQNLENFGSEPENTFPDTTSTPIKTKATISKTTRVNSRNNINKEAKPCFANTCELLKKTK